MTAGPSRRAVLAATGGWLATAWPAAGAGRPVTLVCPFTPGSGSDVIARLLAPVLSARWSRPVVVDNRPGASGTVGTASVARAEPDGNTLLFAINTFTTAPALYPALPYDPRRDLRPVALLAQAGYALVVHPSVPATDVASLVAWLSRQPGRLNYASPGKGTPQHLAMELFRSATQVDVVHVPYKGLAGALIDLLGNQVQLMVASIHSIQPHVASGKVRALAVTAPTPSMPGVRTFREQGVADMEGVDAWYGVLVPARTPDDTVRRLHTDLIAVMQLPEILAALARQGLSPRLDGPEGFAALIERDLARWAGVIRAGGITGD